MFEDWESLLAVGVAVLIAYGAVLWLGIIVWIYRDIRGRTRDTASPSMALLLVVLGFKVASGPFHAWAPDVYEGAP